MRLLYFFFIVLVLGVYGFNSSSEERFISYQIHPQEAELQMFWKDRTGKPYKSFDKLKTELEAEGKQLTFAMNGGMFTTSYGPLGLYVEHGELLHKLNVKQKGYGNFYMQPNGVFMLDSAGRASIIPSTSFKFSASVAFATQSGPMLIVDGKPHPKFTDGSKNVHIRNGVGILPSGEVLFSMSKDKVNLYDFASYFIQKGCISALYLDGFVSRTYLPSKNWIQTDGQFGVIIADTRTITD
ncbi:MAG: phosphodiester glycosidase family protein [Flavobacteriales bacterium]